MCIIARLKNISPEVIDVFGRIQVKTQIKQQLQRLICRPSTLSVPFFSFWPSVDGFSMPLQGSAGSAGSAGSTARASLGSQGGFNVVCIWEPGLPKFMDEAVDWNGYGSIPIDTFLVGWTSIYQLFWGSLGTGVLTHPQMIFQQRTYFKSYSPLKLQLWGCFRSNSSADNPSWRYLKNHHVIPCL